MGLVDCASSIRDKGCRVSQDAQEPPFPSQTANPRPVPVQGTSQGGPFLALLPFSLSPSPVQEGRVLLRAAACCCTVCSPSVRVRVKYAGEVLLLLLLAGLARAFFSSTVSLPPWLPIAALSFSLLSIVNPSPSVHLTDSSLNRQTLFPPLLFFPPRFFMF